MVKANRVVQSCKSARIAGRESYDVQIPAFQKQARADTFLQSSPANDFIAVDRQISEVPDAVQQDVGFQADRCGGLVDRLVRQETQRNTCHLGPGGIPDHPESRGPGIDGLHASHQLIRTIGIRTVKAVVPAPFALIKHHVKEGRQCRIRAAVEPDLNGVQIRGIAEYLLLLRGAQRDVRAPAIGPPALYARANAEARVGKGDALVDFVLVGVGW